MKKYSNEYEENDKQNSRIIGGNNGYGQEEVNFNE